MRLVMPGPAGHKSSPTRERAPLRRRRPADRTCGCAFITFQARLRQISAPPKDGGDGRVDAGAVVLVNASEDAMKTLRAVANSIRTRLDDAAFTVCLSGIAVALATLAGSA